MFADTIQKSVLEWLQLTPELLSGLPGRASARSKSVAAPAPTPAPQAQPGGAEHASISLGTVLPGPASMQFLPATGLAPELQRVAGAAYEPMERGGTQRSALAEMTGYLAADLIPNPMPAKD